MSESACQPPVSDNPRALIVARLRLLVRVFLGLAAPLFFVSIWSLIFGHKCTVEHKTFDTSFHWVAALLALVVVLAFRRIWVIVITLCILFFALQFAGERYLSFVHARGSQQAVGLVVVTFYAPLIAAIVFVALVTVLAISRGKTDGFWSGVRQGIREVLFGW